MSGYDAHATALSLAKALLSQCEGHGDITLPKETLHIVLKEFVAVWMVEQDKKRSDMKKVAH